MRKPLALVGVALLAALTASVAEARPTVWQMSRSPQTFAEDTALSEADHSRTELRRKIVEQRPRQLVLKQQAAAFEGANARTSTNPFILLGFAEVLHDLGDYEGSAPLLEAVLAANPFDDLKARAFYDLAIVAAREHDPQREIALYEAALPYSPIPDNSSYAVSRADTLANQAEAYMLLGDIARAVDGYRAALGMVPASRLPDFTTTFWSLAVALDRSGDLDGGLDELAIAKKYDPGDKQIKGPDWFFVPSYDADWYFGLEALLLARASDDDPVLQALHYASARDHFAAYVANAPMDDHYVAMARAHVEAIKKEASRVKAPDGPKITPLPPPGATPGT